MKGTMVGDWYFQLHPQKLPLRDGAVCAGVGGVKWSVLGKHLGGGMIDQRSPAEHPEMRENCITVLSSRAATAHRKPEHLEWNEWDRI